jgi:hypothetical protein
VDQGPRSMTAHVRLVAEERGGLRKEKSWAPFILIYSLAVGLIALGVGAVASFAASSETAKLVLWSVVTGITAVAAGAARESRWARELSHSVARWIQSAQRL